MIFTDENYVAKKLSRKTRPNPPPEGVNADLETASHVDGPTPRVGNHEVDYKKAAAVMKEIEEKIFCGGLPRSGTYENVFKQVFDVDGDGFISHADFEGACRKLQIKQDHSSIMNAIKALDTENKGFFDFRTFS